MKNLLVFHSMLAIMSECKRLCSTEFPINRMMPKENVEMRRPENIITIITRRDGPPTRLGSRKIVTDGVP